MRVNSDPHLSGLQTSLICVWSMADLLQDEAPHEKGERLTEKKQKLQSLNTLIARVALKGLDI